MNITMTAIATALSLGMCASINAEPANSDPLNIARAATSVMRDAIANDDVELLMQTYADTAVLLPPTDETLADPQLIRRFWSEQADSMKNIDVDWVRCEQSGNTIYSAGVWSATAMGTDGPESVGGNLVNVFTRSDDGIWKTTLQTWN